VAVTVDIIYTEFPEMARAKRDIVAAKLADAEAMTAQEQFGDLRDQRVKYLTCHLVALAPGGEFARLDANKDPDGARTIYQLTLTQLDRAHSYPMVV